MSCVFLLKASDSRTAEVQILSLGAKSLKGHPGTEVASHVHENLELLK